MSLISSLPAPVNQYEVHDDNVIKSQQVVRVSSVKIPPYGQRKRYFPKTVEDFGDGGAFPESHIAQYPLNMGRPGVKGSSQAVIPVTVDKDGNVRHDAIIQQHAGKNQIIHSRFQDLVEKDPSKMKLDRPSREEEDETTERTRKALQKIVQGQVASGKPVALPEQSQDRHKQSQFVRYTPKENAPGFNPEARQRVVRIVEAPMDPLEPPKFKHKKVPRGAPEAPVPVLHSPPRKLTVEDQQAWKIPPCISNWKNNRGYTIALDKRLAADGRSLQQQTINDKFATLSESLIVAGNKARSEVEARAKIRKQLVLKEKEEKEEQLRQLAEKARKERTGIPVTRQDNKSEQYEEAAVASGGSSRPSRSSHTHDYHDEKEEDDTELKRLEREKLRLERKRERERELRMEAAGKKSKKMRDADRDVSEKIALGMQVGRSATGSESMFDTRLFNQSQGLDSGFTVDDTYNVYSKPLREDTGRSVYRPRMGDSDIYRDADKALDQLKNTNKFKPDVDFEGVDRSNTNAARSGPVQFERGGETNTTAKDVYGLDKILNEAKQGRKSSSGVSSAGMMHAIAGGSSASDVPRRSDRKIDFTSSRH